MGLTAAQKRIVEADERFRDIEREVVQNPGDQQNLLRYAVEYLRSNPEVAQEAGINAFTPEDIIGLKNGFNTILAMLRWVSDHSDNQAFWDQFSEEFPVNTLSSHADQNDPDDYYREAQEFIDDREGINRYGIRRFDTAAFGCTSRGQARRWGNWILDVELNSTEQVTYVAGLDHVGVVPGDIVSITDEHYQGIRVGGRLVSATIDSVTLDSEVTLDGVDTYYIQVTLPDNTIQSREISDGAGNYTTLNTVSPFSDTPQKESNWQLK